ncbi:hypothetical protein BKA70DRAFT_825837 [Coprinopsis sp. MPI-PUGE-AT-0042]|nr:hypothetical protein BKA70DRAFT_825837 [Coprinopsis sp. MPI-PUGE-AT-0042]
MICGSRKGTRGDCFHRTSLTPAGSSKQQHVLSFMAFSSVTRRQKFAPACNGVPDLDMNRRTETPLWHHNKAWLKHKGGAAAITFHQAPSGKYFSNTTVTSSLWRYPIYLFYELGQRLSPALERTSDRIFIPLLYNPSRAQIGQRDQPPAPSLRIGLGCRPPFNPENHASPGLSIGSKFRILIPTKTPRSSQSSSKNAFLYSLRI